MKIYHRGGKLGKETLAGTSARNTKKRYHTPEIFDACDSERSTLS